ncbi:MAG: ABC transporter substrate-binding protein [Chloroflexi bacterium]|nr:ABC transporter substrate-binding protein [Chloroflexota bacterium]
MPESAKPGTPGVSSDCIRLGTTCDLSGPNAYIGMAAFRGYSAYYRYVNGRGGVHGRQIDLLVKDDAFDPERTRAAVRKLVEEDQVFAIVSPLGTPTNLAVMDYLLARQVPVVSPHTGASIWALPPKRTYFALQPNYQAEGRLLAQYALELGARRPALYAVDDLFGQEGAAAFDAELKGAGVEPVARALHPARESAPRRWIEELAAAQPDLVALFTYVKPAADLLALAYRRGFRPRWLGSYVLSGPEIFLLAGREALEGMVVTTYPLGPRGHRGLTLFEKLLARDPIGAPPGTHSRIGYAAAQLVVEGLERAGRDLTRDGFIAALESLRDWTGGLLPPITYSPGDRRGLTSLALRRAKEGNWIVERDRYELRE